MIPSCKQEKEKYDSLEQKYNNIKKFTASQYVKTGKIELELNTGTYLFWISTSGGPQNPSLILANLESAAAQFLSSGGMHNQATWSNGTLTITLKNNYGYYGYIKLR